MDVYLWIDIRIFFHHYLNLTRSSLDEPHLLFHNNVQKLYVPKIRIYKSQTYKKTYACPMFRSFCDWEPFGFPYLCLGLVIRGYPECAPSFPTAENGDASSCFCPNKDHKMGSPNESCISWQIEQKKNYGFWMMMLLKDPLCKKIQYSWVYIHTKHHRGPTLHWLLQQVWNRRTHRSCTLTKGCWAAAPASACHQWRFIGKKPRDIWGFP